MNKVAFHTANDVVEVEHLAVDITKNVYFTLSALQLHELVMQAESMGIASFLLSYSKGDMWHLLKGNHVDGDLVMGTHGAEGDIDNYWCDSASILMQTAELRTVVDRARKYQDYEQLRILCKVDEFDISAVLSIDVHFNKPLDYAPFGVITRKECFVRKGGRDYKVVYTSN